MKKFIFATLAVGLMISSCSNSDTSTVVPQEKVKSNAKARIAGSNLSGTWKYNGHSYNGTFYPVDDQTNNRFMYIDGNSYSLTFMNGNPNGSQGSLTALQQGQGATVDWYIWGNFDNESVRYQYDDVNNYFDTYRANGGVRYHTISGIGTSNITLNLNGSTFKVYFRRD